MSVNRVPVTRCRRGGVVGEGLVIDHGVPGNHIGELRCDILLGSSLEVLGFLVKLQIVYWVIGGWWLECGWEGFGPARCLWFGWGWCGCRYLGESGGRRCRIGDELLCGRRGCLFCLRFLGDDIHCGRLGVVAGESWAITGVQVGESSSGARAAARCRAGVV